MLNYFRRFRGGTETVVNGESVFSYENLQTQAINCKQHIVYDYKQKDCYIYPSKGLDIVHLDPLVITRHHELGFGQNIVGILPTSLPQRPVQLIDLRSSQISFKIALLAIYTKYKQLTIYAL